MSLMLSYPYCHQLLSVTLCLRHMYGISPQRKLRSQRGYRRCFPFFFSVLSVFSVVKTFVGSGRRPGCVLGALCGEIPVRCPRQFIKFVQRWGTFKADSLGGRSLVTNGIVKGLGMRSIHHVAPTHSARLGHTTAGPGVSIIPISGLKT